MRLRKAVILAVAILAIRDSQFALDCTCGPVTYGPACQLVGLSEVVFLGRAIGLVPDPDTPSFKLYRFKVQKAYKGIPPEIREVLVDPDNSTSGTTYPIGVDYLMFGDSHEAGVPDVVRSGGCSGSRPASKAQADISFLERYTRGETRTVVYGHVLQYTTRLFRPSNESRAPVAGASVVLTYGDRHYDAVSDSRGNFRIEGVWPGTYSLTAWLEPYVSNAPYQIEVAEGGCAEEFVRLSAKSAISGILLNHDGKPASRMRMELLRRNESGEWHSDVYCWSTTDSWGAFSFDDIPDGDYLLGYEIWGDRPSTSSEYATRYFPGVDERSMASVIHLRPRERAKNLSFSLAPPNVPRRIRISILWPDGSSPGTHLLQLFNGNDLLRNLEGDKQDGSYEFTGYVERAYEFSARYWVDDLRGREPEVGRRIARTDVVRRPPGNYGAEIRLELRYLDRDER